MTERLKLGSVVLGSTCMYDEFGVVEGLVQKL
jgi:hypothetical protein